MPGWVTARKSGIQTDLTLGTRDDTFRFKHQDLGEQCSAATQVSERRSVADYNSGGFHLNGESREEAPRRATSATTRS
jgi:hypothetical protein